MIAPVHLLSIAVLTGVLSLCVLGSLARSGMAGIRETIRANLLTLLAFFLFGLQATEAPRWASILLPNMLISLALCAYYTGVRRLLGQRVPRRLMGVACAAAWLALVGYTYLDSQVAPRIVAMSTLQMGFMFAVAVAVARGVPANRSRYSYYFVWSVAMISGLTCALRSILFATGVAQADFLLQPTTWNIVFMTLGVLAMPCLTLGTIMIIHDRMLADREHEASTDFLTGLMSRKAWWLQAERYCAQALRTRRPLSLLLLDIDHFKRINDTHGHAAGDAVLRHFGLLATATLRTGDHLGRVGGRGIQRAVRRHAQRRGAGGGATAAGFGAAHALRPRRQYHCVYLQCRGGGLVAGREPAGVFRARRPHAVRGQAGRTQSRAWAGHAPGRARAAAGGRLTWRRARRGGDTVQLSLREARVSCFMMRSFSRCQSFSRAVSRLSNSFLPRPSAKSSLMRPFL